MSAWTSGSVARCRSPGAGGSPRSVGGLRCERATQNTQSFSIHCQLYRGLVPADSAFSDLKWRESSLSLKSLLHPTVYRSKTIRHHGRHNGTGQWLHTCNDLAPFMHKNTDIVKKYGVNRDFNSVQSRQWKRAIPNVYMFNWISTLWTDQSGFQIDLAPCHYPNGSLQCQHTTFKPIT